MQRLLAILLVVLGSASAAAAAGPLSGADLQNRISGTTMRGQIWTGDLNEGHIWRFHPDGTLTGTFTAVPLGPQSTNSFIDVNDSGTWQVADGRLCVKWRRILDGIQQCYTLMPLRAGWVRFNSVGGGPTFDAQISR